MIPNVTGGPLPVLLSEKGRSCGDFGEIVLWTMERVSVFSFRFGLLWRGVVPFFPLPSADSVVMALLVLILYIF